jgi:hypothetical protein
MCLIWHQSTALTPGDLPIKGPSLRFPSPHDGYELEATTRLVGPFGLPDQNDADRGHSLGKRLAVVEANDVTDLSAIGDVQHQLA